MDTLHPTRFGGVRGNPISVANQFKPGVAQQAGKPRPPIGKRKAAKRRREATIHETIFGPPPTLTSIEQWLRDVVEGKIVPTGEQLYGAALLVRIPGAITADQARSIINVDVLDDEERRTLATLLLRTMPSGVPQIESHLAAPIAKTKAPPPGVARAPVHPSTAATLEPVRQPRDSVPVETRDERAELLARLRQHDPAAAEQHEREWPK